MLLALGGILLFFLAPCFNELFGIPKEWMQLLVLIGLSMIGWGVVGTKAYENGFPVGINVGAAIYAAALPVISRLIQSGEWIPRSHAEFISDLSLLGITAMGVTRLI